MRVRTNMMAPQGWKVATLPCSNKTTSVQPSFERWNATLVPITPPPMMTVNARGNLSALAACRGHPGIPHQPEPSPARAVRPPMPTLAAPVPWCSVHGHDRQPLGEYTYKGGTGVPLRHLTG